MTDFVFRLCQADEWEIAQQNGVYTGSELDRKDGFIHLSTESQVRDTANLYFRGVPGLVLLKIDAGALGDALRWEISRDDQLFPHLYGDLPVTAVRESWTLELDTGNRHIFPEIV